MIINSMPQQCASILLGDDGVETYTMLKCDHVPSPKTVYVKATKTTRALSTKSGPTVTGTLSSHIHSTSGHTTSSSALVSLTGLQWSTDPRKTVGAMPTTSPVSQSRGLSDVEIAAIIASIVVGCVLILLIGTACFLFRNRKVPSRFSRIRE
ncbi:hypothetical protein F4779DRAFT_213116 [Xylariaceae sp. FL0662B]|nr:hypothetical protein F4779DRAFT_213116 [Xylariaceae sp. FL0662B]